MSDFVSDVQKIPYGPERVFAKLSDLNQLKNIKDLLPKGKIDGLTFDADSCSFQVETFGTIALRITERAPNQTIKFDSEKSPLPFTCWIQLKEVANEETCLRLTLRADIPFVFKGMVSKPLEESVKKCAEALAKIAY